MLTNKLFLETSFIGHNCASCHFVAILSINTFCVIDLCASYCVILWKYLSDEQFMQFVSLF